MSRPGKPVVVGVTGTPFDTAAIRLAATEAVLRHRPVLVAAGYPPLGADADLAGPVPPHESARRAVRSGVAALRAAHGDIAVDGRVAPVDPAEALVELSADAELVVVPAQPYLPAACPRAGMAERVAAHARCPVLVAHDTAVPGGDVLVAVDCGAPAGPVLEYGFQAAAARGVALRPVYVRPALPQAALNTLDPFQCTPDPFQYSAPTAGAEADRLLAEEVAGWGGTYPDVPLHRRTVRAPDVARALAGLSATAAVLVVGARGVPPRGADALGTVTRRLIAAAGCPVAVVSMAEPHDATLRAWARRRAATPY